jgi:hypothetical protein
LLYDLLFWLYRKVFRNLFSEITQNKRKTSAWGNFGWRFLFYIDKIICVIVCFMLFLFQEEFIPILSCQHQQMADRLMLLTSIAIIEKGNRYYITVIF